MAFSEIENWRDALVQVYMEKGVVGAEQFIETLKAYTKKVREDERNSLHKQQ